MIPEPNCALCTLSTTRKCIVPSLGLTPADVFILLDAPTETDEMLQQLLAGPDGKLMTSMLFQAAERTMRKFSFHIATMTMCRPHTKGVDRPPAKPEILRCMNNLMTIYAAVMPQMVILVGDRTKLYYGREFPESVSISPPWLVRKHPGLWLNTVQTIADGLNKYLKG